MNRRDFLVKSAFAAALPLAASKNQTHASQSKEGPRIQNLGPESLNWLGGQAPQIHTGSVWGLPWPQGELQPDEPVALHDEAGTSIPVQTWVNAYWPDGSVKWTAHAIPPQQSPSSKLTIKKGHAALPETPVAIVDRGAYLQVDTGTITCYIPASGDHIFSSIERDGVAIAQNARLIGSRLNSLGEDYDAPSPPDPFQSVTESLTVEQSGPVRAVILVKGKHKTAAGRKWLPFTLRLSFFAGSAEARISHTFIYDGDEHSDFIKSLGLRFEVPQRDEMHNRHVRFAGEESGLWAEAVRGLTGLRRNPGEEVKAAQVAGLPTPPPEEWDTRVSSRIRFIPTWGDFTLTQGSANGFTIRKRTKPGHGWIDADQGGRSAGTAYLGGTSGGVLFGMRDFWKLHPTQIDIRKANTDVAEATLWIWSPEAEPMDLRFYHDGMDMDTYEEQYEGGLEIIYEDYEPGFGTPYGIARTTDIYLFALAATPSREDTVALAKNIAEPPLITASPQRFLNSGVFGSLWSLPDRSSKKRATIEDRLDWSVQYYKDQVDQRHWYGFWHYGDVMHTYDVDRNVWRYDIGGYAWDNSELSPDLWLWYSFLRTGGRDEFRLAEAMTRHTRDVDIYHLGKWAGLGTRHNVQHWGCSAKQLRISTSAYRRFHYYLTGDERTGDVLDEVTEADKQLANLVPTRKLKGRSSTPTDTRIGVGTDFGSAASNWLTAWERTGDPKYKSWLKNAMIAIGSQKYGFFSGDFGYDPDTKKLLPPENPNPGVSHLSAVFGLVEVCTELIQLIDVPEFKQAWIQYCTFYNAPKNEQQAELGAALRGNGLQQAHSRLTAYAAKANSDKALAKRAWSEFEKEWGGKKTIGTTRITGPDTLNPVYVAPWVSTNDSSQWGLAAIQCLALVPEEL